MPADPYAILEVSPRASVEVIKGAYFALVNPLVDPTSPTWCESPSPRYVELKAAFDLLSDPAKRAAHDKENAPAAGTLVGNHRILSFIAEGGFGTTYRGEHTITKDAVCIKHCSSISAAHDEILIQEARALGTLRHHALPAMRDLHRMGDGSLALVMDFVPGPTLEQVIEKVGKLDPETAAWITERLLNALLFLHHNGVIHGDIKPQNVIVQPADHAVVLVDFGLAQIKPTTYTKAKGYTKFFAPPEQIESAERDVKKPLIPASDFYSLGQLMIYALSGGLDAVKKQIVPVNVPTPICQFIRRITVADPLARPQGDLFEEFRNIRQKAFGRTRSGMKPIPGL